MKKHLLILAVLGFACSSWAAVPEKTEAKEYTFKFRLNGEMLEVRRPAKTYEEAFEKAADTCFKHYKKSYGGRVNEDQGLDIIDVCANPRS